MAKNNIENLVHVKNADGDKDTTAVVLIQNKIDYTPKVSVIIPVYNVEKYLRQCLDSVMGQTLKEIEIICVDDGSTDNSLEILKEYAARDNRITVLSQQNLHAGVARNAGLAVARGEYLSFLDSDDFFELNMLEEMYKSCKETDSDVAICRAAEFTSSGISSLWWAIKEQYLNDKTQFSCKDPEFAKYLFQSIIGFPWNKIYRKSFVDENKIYFSSSHHHNDTAFVMATLVGANSIVYVKHELVNYRKREDSLCHKKSGNIESLYVSIIDTYNMIKNKKNYVMVEQSFTNYIIEFCQHYHAGLVSEDLKQNLVPYMYKLNEQFKITDCQLDYVYDLKKFNYLLDILIPYSKKIPVILASDDNYAPYMHVTMVSMLDSADKHTYYDFYIMVPSAFSEENKNLILSLQNKYVCDINFIDMKNQFSDLTMQISHITSPTYYRLLAADLLPQEYKKCIYLDVDICVCKDLAEFFNIDLQDNYVAGVVAAGYYFNEESNCKRLGLKSMKTYLNAGVLIMNLDEIRKNNLTPYLLRLSKKNYSSQDQDVINIACYGKIKTLPPVYNVMTMRIKENDERLKELFSENELLEARTNPAIIHYADKIKPWNKREIFMGNYWWKAAKKAGFKKSNIDGYKKDLVDWWRRVKKQELDLDNPKTFNEKIQWSKLYDSTPIKTRLADKFLVRDWVAEKIGEEYLIPLLGVYDYFEEIDFDKLPNQFVIKCNHGCGYNIIVKDKSKLDLNEVKAKLDKWMTENFAFKWGVELHYRDIPPKIIIEKFMDDGTGDLRDYKFTCFNGEPEFIWMDSDRHSEHKRNLYDLQWNQLDYKVNSKYSTFPSPEKPECLEEMVELARKLSADFNYVRVDFYIINNRVYFGEMTFTSSSGTEDICPKSFEKRLSNLFKLPKLAYNIDTGEYYKLPKISKIKYKTLKPYILFPYYLISCMYLGLVKLPLMKLMKHVYRRTYRGKISFLKSQFNKMTQLIHDDIVAQIGMLKQSIHEKTVAQIDVLENKYSELSKQISQISKIIADGFSVTENRVFYSNDWSTARNTERGMCDMVSAPNFEERFKRLMSGLSSESAETIVKIIRRLQMIKGTTGAVDLFSDEEQKKLKRVYHMSKEILKISDELYAYRHYLLPVNHFEPSVFLYNHGIDQLDSLEVFQDKDILDVGGFIGDSVLMLSPLTSGCIHSFEATKENFDYMQKTIELNGIKNAVLVHAAVGDTSGVIDLRFNGSASSQDEIMVQQPKYIERCPVITIDDYVREHNIKVGLIKVDIEGAEQAFLRGAKETISEQKPTLLISIYHNVDDFLDIKPMIESWNLGYKFKIFKPTIGSVSAETLLICEQ